MNGFQNPYMNPYGIGSFTPFQQQSPAPQQVVRVNGENGAKSYQIGANSSALLLDESGLMVWLVTSDGAGYKTVAAYDITPHQAAPVPDFGSLESRIKRLEDIVNDTADTKAVRWRNTAADQADDQHAPVIRKPSGDDGPAYTNQSRDEAGHGDRPAVWR